jgi:hypothetical protein
MGARNDDARVSRRTLLLGGVALTGAAGAITSTASGADEPVGWAATYLRQVRGDAFEARLFDGDRRVVVTLRPDAQVSHDGDAVLSDFIPGERIVLEGARGSTGFQATAIRLLYERVEARVTSRDGSTLDTTEGVVQFDGGTLARDQAPIGSTKAPARTLDSIAAGDVIAVFGRRDPRSGQLVARGVGVAANS